MTRPVLLLGANGQLGTSWRQQADLLGLVCATRDGRLADGTAAETADLAHPASLRPLLDRIQPRLIINAAAYTAVDQAESEPALAMRVNAESVAELGSWAAQHQARVVHYSTDYVFDGQSQQPYRETDPTAPLGVYGRSKLAGEQALLASGADALIFRTAWVYARHGRNFLNTMLRLAAERNHLKVVADQIGCPTSTWRIVDASLHAIQDWPDASQPRIWHLTASGQTSWHGFASALLEYAHQHGRLARCPSIEPISTAEYPTPAQRPAWSVLETMAFQQHFHYKIDDWHLDFLRVMAYSI